MHRPKPYKRTKDLIDPNKSARDLKDPDQNDKALLGKRSILSKIDPPGGLGLGLGMGVGSLTENTPSISNAEN